MKSAPRPLLGWNVRVQSLALGKLCQSSDQGDFLDLSLTQGHNWVTFLEDPKNAVPLDRVEKMRPQVSTTPEHWALFSRVSHCL